MKVLILTCSTGEGHNSAARAIAEFLTDSGVENQICDPLDFKSGKAAARAEKIYGNTIRYAPKFFGFVYALGKFYDFLRLPNPVYAANAACAKSLGEHIKRGGFTHVICTHLFAMQAMTAVRKKYAAVPCYGVLTDYTAIPFYKDTDLDGYFVADEHVRNMLIKKRIPKEKIFISGIPVSRKFEKSNMRAAEDKPKRVVILSGGAGCGNAVKLCTALRKNLDKDCEILVFPAKNKRLKARLDKKFARAEGVTAFAFTRNMHEYIKEADVVLTKAGGLSSTEIAAANVPLVHLKSIPGCETANRKKFVRCGMSVYAPTVRRAVKATGRLLGDSGLAEAMRKNQRRFINPNAAEEIVETVLGGEIKERKAI